MMVVVSGFSRTSQRRKSSLPVRGAGWCRLIQYRLVVLRFLALPDGSRLVIDRLISTGLFAILFVV